MISSILLINYLFTLKSFLSFKFWLKRFNFINVIFQIYYKIITKYGKLLVKVKIEKLLSIYFLYFIYLFFLSTDFLFFWLLIIIATNVIFDNYGIMKSLELLYTSIPRVGFARNQNVTDSFFDIWLIDFWYWNYNTYGYIIFDIKTIL